MLAALQNVRPSHLLDRGLWARLGLAAAREDGPAGDPPLDRRAPGRPGAWPEVRPTTSRRRVLDGSGPAPRCPALSAAGAAAPGRSSRGLYAWTVTVAPVAWSRSGSAVSEGRVRRSRSSRSPLEVARGAAMDPGARGRQLALGVRARLRGRVVGVAGSAPRARRASTHTQGLAGMLGWALFALAAAAPALAGARAPERLIGEPNLPARRRATRGDVVYVMGGCVLAAGLQIFGWRSSSPERALLVRLVALAVGLAVIGASVELATARHARRVVARPRRRPRPAPHTRSWCSGLAVAVGLALAAR